MTCLSLTIASFLAAISAENQHMGQQMTPAAEPACIEPCESWTTKQQMLETGLLMMDRYDRYLKEPKLTLNPQRIA